MLTKNERGFLDLFHLRKYDKKKLVYLSEFDFVNI